MQVQPYLFFAGCCEEALAFYRQALGAEVTMMMRYAESPDPAALEHVAPGSEEKIMHASLRIGETVVMAADMPCPEPVSFGGFSLSITPPDATAADRMFNALADGGSVQMPLDETFWSPRFGMLTDRFGVPWMINLAPEEA